VTTPTFQINDEACAEFVRQYDLLLEHNPERAERFRSEVLIGLKEINAGPKKFAYLPGRIYRSYGPTKREKYRIAYVEIENRIVVLAVYYSGIANPLYWEGRAF
jgi:hypothetical protein